MTPRSYIRMLHEVYARLGVRTATRTSARPAHTQWCRRTLTAETVGAMLDVDGGSCAEAAYGDCWKASSSSVISTPSFSMFGCTAPTVAK